MPRFHVFSRLVVALLVMSFFAAFAGNAAFAVGNVGNITGLVLDQSTGKAAAGATVTAETRTAVTDATGKYTLKTLTAGTHIVTAAGAGHATASTTVIVPRNGTVTAPTLMLTQSLIRVSGTVTDATNNAIANAFVSVSGTTISVTTDSAGRFGLAKIPAGVQALIVTAEGYQPAAQGVVILSGGNCTANFTLSAQATPLAPGNAISWNGKNLYLAGCNYAWWNYGTDFGTGEWGKYTYWDRIGTDFASMRAQGVTTVRWWVFADGRYSPDFNDDGTVSGLDEQFLADVDTALKMAHDNHILLIPCLMDFPMFGGIQSENGVSGGGHSALATDIATRQSYLDNALKPFLQHVAASPYKSSVIAYDICNEPEFEVAELWNGGPTSRTQMRALIQLCAIYIHQYGGGAYATMGSAADYWVGNWTGLGLDFYQIHWYPNFTGRGLSAYADLHLDRPCIVGEFPTNNNDYIFGSTAYFSAQWFLDTIANQGYAGALGWGYQTMDAQCNWIKFQSVFVNWLNSNAAPTSNAASFVKTDTDTQGNWQGVYGSEGYNLISSAVRYPDYAWGWGIGIDAWTWEDSTVNNAALRKVNSADDCVAACWYAADNFLVDTNLTDGQTHQVSLYCVDYDQLNRAQTIDVLDADTNAVLDTRSLSSFQNGVYLVWNIKGHVKFRLTNTAGPALNSVLSGVFFN